MTKPVVAAAALVLVDEGVLTLDQPVDDLLPELADRRVLRDPAGPLHDTVPATRAITVEDLLTFRFGLGGIFDESPIAAAMEDGQLGMGAQAFLHHLPADEWMGNLGALPLASQPGEVWRYHTSAEVLGVLVGRACGSSLGEVLQQRVLGTLGMVDTGFRVPADQLHRLGAAYDETNDGLRPWDGAAHTSAYGDPPPFEDAGGGLVSTLDDLLRFGAMMRDGGDGLISEDLHRAMTTNHLTPEQIEGGGFFLGGSGWGYGQEVSVGGNGHPGRYGWYGGFGSVWLNDPGVDLTMLLLTSVSFNGPTGPRLLDTWQTTAYAALAR